MKIESGGGACGYICERATTSSPAGGLEIINAADGPMTFQTNNSEKVRIDSEGKVGIGTASPDKRLHLVTAGSGSGSDGITVDKFEDSASSFGELRIRKSASDTAGQLSVTSADDTLGRLAFYGVAAPGIWRQAAMIDAVQEYATTGRIPSRLEFKVDYGAEELGTVMVLNRERNVGIGTVSPGEKLEVNGNIKTSGNIEIDGDLNHDGSNVGFFDTTPTSKQTVTGSKGGNAALASLITALENYGLIDDQTT